MRSDIEKHLRDLGSQRIRLLEKLRNIRWKEMDLAKAARLEDHPEYKQLQKDIKAKKTRVLKLRQDLDHQEFFRDYMIGRQRCKIQEIDEKTADLQIEYRRASEDYDELIRVSEELEQHILSERAMPVPPLPQTTVVTTR